MEPREDRTLYSKLPRMVGLEVLGWNVGGLQVWGFATRSFGQKASGALAKAFLSVQNGEV